MSWPVAVAGMLVRPVASPATGHLSAATAWCQCGQSVDTERERDPGSGARDTGGQCMAGPHTVWCRGGDVKWAAGAGGAGPELSPLSSRPQTGGFVASGRPHSPKCASAL